VIYGFAPHHYDSTSAETETGRQTDRHRDWERERWRALLAGDDEKYSRHERENFLASIIMREDCDDFADKQDDEADEGKEHRSPQRH